MSSLVTDVVAASSNRRSFLKTVSFATAGVAALSLADTRRAAAATSTEVKILQFALNLEYLEAEFYSYAVHGRGIESFGIGTNGQANWGNSPDGGRTEGGKQVAFKENLVDSREIAAQIGEDERAHVQLLRTALGEDKIAKPDLNLDALHLSNGCLEDYLRQARIFEDVGVSAYAGAAGMLITPAVITTAARILATEGEHVASLRTQIALLEVSTMKLDDADILPPPSGARKHILSVNPQNGLVATRTPQQILYLAFGNRDGASRGGFFPLGVNGAITTSDGPAPASNLNTQSAT